MNEILRLKIEELNNRKEFECWYLVRHEVNFGNICYMVSILEEFKSQQSMTGNFEEYFNRKITEVNTNKGTRIPLNYRSLRLGCFFGLISKYDGQYINATPTQTYNEIKDMCGGNFENEDLYSDVVRRQIEKIYISSSIDEEYDGIRKDFRIFPVIFLYKILLELGETTGNYSISMDEYRYIVATTGKYKDYLKTLFLVNLLREESQPADIFPVDFRGKFDNRFIQALKLLNSLDINNNSISIKEEYVDELSKIVFNFERNKSDYTDDDYLKFLGSSNGIAEQASDYQTEGNYANKIEYPHNRILFGAPGTGKSYKLEKQSAVFGNNYERVTFHPNYSYAQFVGTYKPKPKKDKPEGKEYISYEFVPGPFLRVWIKAKLNPNENFLLIVEEINRANVAAAFGDIFQLLDRKVDGSSEYSVTTTEEMRNYLVEKGFKREEIKTITIPGNMYIWATMNSADQGVLPMDTAFKRRWHFEYISINEGSDKILDKTITLLPYGKVKWDALRTKINDILTAPDLVINEDKLIGAFFLSEKELSSPDIDNIFKNKLLMYLFEDVLKHKKGKLFKQGLTTFSKVIDTYDKKENIFDFEVNELSVPLE